MPEGDTIFRIAARLRALWEGQPIDAARSADSQLSVESLVGRFVQAVEARGKHLLIHIDDGRALHCHLGMSGSWHIYQRGEPWRKPQRRATLVLETGTVLSVCFSPKTLELLTAAALQRHTYLRRLGPDLLAHRVNEEEVLRRFRVHDPTPVGQALMNQSIVCGVGNVYKSETLFLSRIHPFTLVSQLSDQELVRMMAQARQLMARNVTGYPRRTRFGHDGCKLWVYGRSGEPCLVCGQRICMRRQGELGRSTYWCPACQQLPR